MNTKSNIQLAVERIEAKHQFTNYLDTYLSKEEQVVLVLDGKGGILTPKQSLTNYFKQITDPFEFLPQLTEWLYDNPQWLEREVMVAKYQEGEYYVMEPVAYIGNGTEMCYLTNEQSFYKKGI